MDTIAFWLAVVGYIAVWCAVFSPLAWLIQAVGRLPKPRAETIAFSACYVGAVFAAVVPLLVIAANNPSFRLPAEVLEALQERCPAGWCSKLLAGVERPR